MNVQDLIVTAVALLSAGVVARRLVGTFRPEPSKPACANCSSAAPCGPAPAESPAPLLLQRRP